jgi:hypothetical protein
MTLGGIRIPRVPPAAGQEVDRDVTIGKTRIGKPEEDDGCEHEFSGFEGSRQWTPQEIPQ